MFWMIHSVICSFSSSLCLTFSRTLDFICSEHQAIICSTRDILCFAGSTDSIEETAIELSQICTNFAFSHSCINSLYVSDLMRNSVPLKVFTTWSGSYFVICILKNYFRYFCVWLNKRLVIVDVAFQFPIYKLYRVTILFFETIG